LQKFAQKTKLFLKVFLALPWNIYLSKSLNLKTIQDFWIMYNEKTLFFYSRLNQGFSPPYCDLQNWAKFSPKKIFLIRFTL
jgi:hypothetical protein